MWYNTKGLAPAFLCHNILLFLIIQVNCQFPNLLPHIPNLLPPISIIVPSIPNLQPPIPNSVPPIPNLLPPIPKIVPPIPNLIPPIPKIVPPIPNIVPPIPNLLPPIPNIVPPIPNLLPPIPNIVPPVPNLLPPIPNIIPPIPNLLPPIPNLPSIPGLMSPPSTGTESCPKDTTKFKVECANVLGIPVLPVGALLNPLKTPCCKFIQGLVDIEAAVCVCRALSFNNTIPKINIPVSVVLLLNYCRKDSPPGFVCASS